MRETECRILSNNRIAEGIYKLTVRLPFDFNEQCLPGQFAHIKIPFSNEHILRRPISINSVGSFNDTVTFVYQTVGEGTDKLSHFKEGTELKILLPQGNGFKSREGRRILLAGAGIGAAPLKHYAETNRNNAVTAVLGFRCREKAYQINDFKRVCREVIVCSDDGSIGIKALAADAAREAMNRESFDLIVACGPRPFLRQIARLARETGTECEISMEARMGCGIGACMGCNVAVKDKDGRRYYKRCCAEGPVFDSREVVFDD